MATLFSILTPRIFRILIPRGQYHVQPWPRVCHHLKHADKLTARHALVKTAVTFVTRGHHRQQFSLRILSDVSNTSYTPKNYQRVMLVETSVMFITKGQHG